MRNFLLGVVAMGSLVGGSLAVETAQAAPQAQLISGVYNLADAPSLQPAQFIFGGQNYCWYAGGWRGPGFYWCGYAWRRGLGWGGGEGWHGWRGGGRGGSRGAQRSNSGGTHAGGAHAGGVHAGGVHGAAAGGAVHSGGVHGAAAGGGGHAGGGGGAGGGGHAGGGARR